MVKKRPDKRGIKVWKNLQQWVFGRWLESNETHKIAVSLLTGWRILSTYSSRLHSESAYIVGVSIHINLIVLLHRA